jgi:hypothetical protein
MADLLLPTLRIILYKESGVHMRDMPLQVVDNLLMMRAIQRSSLPFILTLEDYDIFVICACHFLAGNPVNLKCLLSYEIGPSKTIHRRLTRLRGCVSSASGSTPMTGARNGWSLIGTW